MSRYATIIFSLVLLTACNEQGRGFNLPKGDVEQGKMTFVLMQCNDCHTVKGIDFIGDPDGTNVFLGGKTTRVASYGDLVTSIINPSHKLSRGSDPTTVTLDGESKMRNYNEYMSVQELIDLVEFLQSRYEIWVPTYYTYGY